MDHEVDHKLFVVGNGQVLSVTFVNAFLWGFGFVVP